MKVQETSRWHRQLLQGYYDTNISGSLLDFSIYWARMVNSEQESLLTYCTKHTFYELQYILDGHISMQVNDKTIAINQSELVIIPPDTFHQIIEAEKVGARFIMAFSVSSKDERLTGAIQSLTNIIPQTETPFFKNLLPLMMDGALSASDCRCFPLLMETLLLELLAIVSPYENRGAASSVEHQTENQKRMTEIMDFIRLHHGIGVSISSLSKHFALSERHLSRIFKIETGQTLKEFINHEKLKRIEYLTASTSLSLNEISELCGFGDEYGMNKFFRRFNLVNLSEYRKLAKK